MEKHRELFANPIGRKIAVLIGTAMLMDAVTFSLTAIAVARSPTAVELNPNVSVGSMLSLLASEISLLACGFVALKLKKDNDDCKAVLCGFVMALMSGDLANDVIQTLMPTQHYIAAVGPMLVSVGTMAAIAMDVAENRR